MSRQDKAVTERHAKILRELIRRPENKLCADCKRHDPRWASWNIGAFVCIRCSGIHRSMGTHISKVKSVDLDVWTPEQMESIQKWGNVRVNLYWEAHLGSGHTPPDHKVESFIRSKYESRRWALDGPPPQDPSILESGAVEPPQQTAPPPQAQPPVHAPQPKPISSSTSRQNSLVPPPVQSATRPTQAHQLLSATHRSSQPTPPPLIAPVRSAAQAPPPPPASKPVDDLFSLDFNMPATSKPEREAAAPKKDVKSDILSLYSATPTAGGVLSGGTNYAQPNIPAAQPVSMTGNGVGFWGESSGWKAPLPVSSDPWSSTPAAPAAQARPQASLFDSPADVWGSAANNGSANQNSLGTTAKKDDMFGDIWSGFK
ncbi:ArfGap-domain-containing protein [Sistotremastrum suecicum HHB10207 ss-3]|uniref:ArfGap-domain-containing protein n=1 Tax=Sistotremastrum suecicum HHB10207 ss-3 TaxID=1314776 RepID=A0A166ALJ3_9AGAM|nr:ArfGap-domain-containing protein [Sistotremastrum suecicum HHB10207 ss-3]